MTKRAEPPIALGHLPPNPSARRRGDAFVPALASAWVLAMSANAALAQDLPAAVPSDLPSALPSDGEGDAPAELHVHAEARNTEGLRLFVRAQSADPWDFACELPCDLRRAPGAWELAVSPDESHEPLAIERTILFETDGVLFLGYASREAARIFGGLLLGHGLAGLVATGVGYGATMDEPLVEFWLLPLIVSLVLTIAGPLLLTASPSGSARWRPGTAEE